MKSPAKSINAALIEKYTGVENYKARADQIAVVMKYVTAQNYKNMKKRVSELDVNDTVAGSSNFSKFIELFESDNSDWIDEINMNL